MKFILTIALLVTNILTFNVVIAEPHHWPETCTWNTPQEYAACYYGEEYVPFDSLVMKESGWNHQTQNPNSSAYGICQFLDSTWELYGGKTDDPYKQLDKCFDYIRDRYETPTRALEFHIINGWY